MLRVMMRQLGKATGGFAVVATLGLATTAIAGPLDLRPTLFSTSAPIGAGSTADIFTPGDPGVTPDVVNVPAGLPPQIAIHEGVGGGFATNGLGLPFLPGLQVDAFSRGDDMDRQIPTGKHGVASGQQYSWLFSVDASATGKSGGVLSEAAGSAAAADVFMSQITIAGGLGISNISPGLNELGYDADGSFGLPSMGLIEGTDDIDALDVSYATHPEADHLSGPNYFSLDSASAAFAALPAGISGADVFVSAAGAVAPVPYASFAMLGLQGNDDLDALAIAENGNGIYEPALSVFDWTDESADMLLFSLAPGSPTLGSLDALRGLPIEAGDVLTYISGAGVGVLVPAEDLGLNTLRTDGFADNLNALDVVPEPSTYVMSAIGLFALGFFGWRRRQAAA